MALPFDSYLTDYAAWPVLIGPNGMPRFALWRTLRQNLPTEIVLHSTSVTGLGKTFAANAIWLTKKNSSQVSAHFLVGRCGQLAMLLPPTYIANHAGDWPRNVSSIGIESVHGIEDSLRGTDGLVYPLPQLATLVQLVAELCELFDIPPERVIGHRDIITTLCPLGLDLDMIRARVRRLL